MIYDINVSKRDNLSDINSYLIHMNKLEFDMSKYTTCLYVMRVITNHHSIERSDHLVFIFSYKTGHGTFNKCSLQRGLWGAVGSNEEPTLEAYLPQTAGWRMPSVER